MKSVIDIVRRIKFPSNAKNKTFTKEVNKNVKFNLVLTVNLMLIEYGCNKTVHFD